MRPTLRSRVIFFLQSVAHLVNIYGMKVMMFPAEPPQPAAGSHAAAGEAFLRVMFNLVKMMGLLLRLHPWREHAVPMHRYLMGGARRFARVLQRIAAGEVFRARPSRAGQARTPRERMKLPRHRGWVGSLGYQVRGFAGQLKFILEQPEMAALVAASPQAQRVLRPMFHVLGLEMACVPRLVRRPTKASPVAGEPPSPRPSPANPGEGEGRRRLTRREREANLWYANSEGKPMKLLPKKLPRD